MYLLEVLFWILSVFNDHVVLLPNSLLPGPSLRSEPPALRSTEIKSRSFSVLFFLRLSLSPLRQNRDSKASLEFPRS